MSNSTPDDSDPSSEEGVGESVSDMNFSQWIETLRRSDRSLYNLIALEAWSIAKTMDGLIPGFWNRFMENRRVALKEFVDQRKTQTKPTHKQPSEH